MASKKIHKQIERLSEELVLVEAGDRKTLEKIRKTFGEIAEWAAKADLPDVAAAAESAADLTRKLIGKEVSDVRKTMDILGQAAAAIQAIVCDGHSPDKAAFPRELDGGKRPRKKTAPSPEKKEEAKAAPAPPSQADAEIFTEFLARRVEIVSDLEAVILELEKSATEENIKTLRGLIHTLKGDSAVLGLDNVERVCHGTEDLLDTVPAKQAVDSLLKVKDWLSDTFDYYAGEKPAPPDMARLMTKLADRSRPAPKPEPPPQSEEPAAPIDMELLESFLAEANEHLDAAEVHLLTLESSPENKEALNAVFRGFHTIKGAAAFLNLDDIRLLAHETESLLDRARKDELALDEGVMDVIFRATDHLKKLVVNLHGSFAAGKAPPPDPALPPLLAEIKAVVEGEIALEPQPVPEPGAPAPGATVAEQPLAPGTVPIRETVKVDADRLDRLLDTIGELVIAETMVSQSKEFVRMASPELDRRVVQLDKITRSLQAMSTSLRMVPVRPVFLKMARLVRDVAKKAGKRIDFTMSGENTELDKAVVDRIGDPLVHLLRNAVDHGIEDSPAARRKAGKSEAGHIDLRAFHRGGAIYIEVEDDGRGFNRDAILSRAKERGLVSEGANLTDEEVYHLVFMPGFSTAKIVTDVSGRGVGLDVVKRSVDGLRGQVEIQSEPSRGSTIGVRLPLSLAIIDGMIVRVGTERYIIPTLSIVRSVRPQGNSLSTVVGRGEMLSVEGRLIPLFRLARLFRIEEAKKDATEALVVVVEDNARQTALLVDDLLGQQQIVIKGIGDYMSGVLGISGGAIMPDGQVGLIIDVGGLVRLAHSA